jgi:hypothetical protein
MGAPVVDTAAFTKSIHGGNLCVSCHADAAEIPHPEKTGAGLLRQVPPPGNPDLPAIRPRARRRPGQGGSGLLQRLPRPQPHAVELPEPRLARQPKKNSRHLRRLPRQGRRTGQRALDRTQTRRFLRPHRSRDRVRGGKGQRGRLLRLPRHARSPRVRQPGQPGQPGPHRRDLRRLPSERSRRLQGKHSRQRQRPRHQGVAGLHRLPRRAHDPIGERPGVHGLPRRRHQNLFRVPRIGAVGGEVRFAVRPAEEFHGHVPRAGVETRRHARRQLRVVPRLGTMSCPTPTPVRPSTPPICPTPAGAATREPKPSSCRDAFTRAPTTVRICGS